MARKLKTASAGDVADRGEGDNLTPEQEERALLLHHFDKLRQQEAKAIAKKAEYDAERATLTDLFRVAKADGFMRKELQALLDDTASMGRNLTEEEERRAKLRAWVGLPAGTQLDLFNSPLEVQDEQHARGVGYAMGLRGDPCQMPDHLQPRFAQAFADAWGRGQEELAWGLSAAGRIIDRKPNANAAPVGLEPEPDEDDENPVAKAARAIADEDKAANPQDWAQPTAEERQLEDAAA